MDERLCHILGILAHDRYGSVTIMIVSEQKSVFVIPVNNVMKRTADYRHFSFRRVNS